MQIPAEENLPPTSIFRIKSKYVHSILDQYLPKLRLLKIANWNKRLQNLSQLSTEIYEVYHLLRANKNKKFSLSERPLDSSLLTMKTIFELTKSELLFSNHSEIDVPVPFCALIQLKTYEILASSESALYMIDYNDRKEKFTITKEIKLECVNAAIINLVEIGEHLILASTFNKAFIVNLDTEEVTFEINGCCPIKLKDGRIAYIVDENVIRIEKIGDVDEPLEINIVKEHLKPGEDTRKYNKIAAGIQSKNGNIIIGSWDHTIGEYDIATGKCIQVIQTDIDYITFLCELKDTRIAVTAEDNGNIYIIKRNSQCNTALRLSGHNGTVIKILQLENEQLISGSQDGKVKIWYKLNDGGFNCAMTLYLFDDFIKDFIFMHDGRILITSDDKTLRALGVKNFIGNFSIEFIPEDKKKKTIKNFQLIDTRIIQ